MFKKILLFLACGLFASSTKASSSPKAWQREALKQLRFIKKTLNENHPGVFDEESGEFNEWMNKAEKLIHSKVDLVSDEKSLQQFLIWYTKGFKDNHLSISFDPELAQREKLEWPGFLLNYDPSSGTFREGRNTSDTMDQWAVTEIDGIPIKKWIDTNRIPYHRGALEGLESGYVKTAPWALTTYNLPPATKKPAKVLETYCGPLRIFRQREISLCWESISYQDLFKKVVKLRNFPQTQLSSITLHHEPNRDLTKDDSLGNSKKNLNYVYVRIPTFNADTPEIKASLEEVAQRIKNTPFKNTQFQNYKDFKNPADYKNIVFDLRGNTGGNSYFGWEILKNLYGSGYFRQYAWGNSEDFVHWRASKDNIHFLANNPFMTTEQKEAFSGTLNNLKQALKSKQNFYRENTKPFMMRMLIPSRCNPTIYVIIDAQCASASLDFIDLVKSLSKKPVILMGHPTSADSFYMDCRAVDLPTNLLTTTKMQLHFPMKVLSGRKRKSNEPYAPNIYFETESLNNDEKLHSLIKYYLDKNK